MTTYTKEGCPFKDDCPDPDHHHTDKVDRFEVIDETGRAYFKGSIYGSPVKVELSYQDGGKTLKVFVTERANLSQSNKEEK